MIERQRQRLLFSASFQVRGIPKGQPRARAFARKIEAGTEAATQFKARMYDAGTAEAWKADVIRCSERFRPPVPIENPVRIEIDIFLERTKKYLAKKYPVEAFVAISKPDRDNCEKAILDAMRIDGWFRDDCIVIAGPVRKLYAARDGVPGARITVTELEPFTTLSQLNEMERERWK